MQQLHASLLCNESSWPDKATLESIRRIVRCLLIGSFYSQKLQSSTFACVVADNVPIVALEQ